MKRLCSCWLKKKEKATSPRSQDEEDGVYGTIPSAADLPKPAVSFRTRTKPVIHQSDRKSTPSTTHSSSHQHTNSADSRKSISFFPFRKKQQSPQHAPKRELPKVPKKSAFNRNLPAIDDLTNPTYESIDAENDSISDPLYSKVDENPASQRYDYPTFRSKANAPGRQKVVGAPRPSTSDEPLYTSASQIYSGGSEDPYSSIVNDPQSAGARNRRQISDDSNSIYDPGYARVKDPVKPSTAARKQNGDGSREPLNVDQLYAKINRPSVRKLRALDEETVDESAPGPSTSRANTNVSFAQDTSVYQTNESGSGSIVSGSSTNPSYRYLTVREAVDVVRERIRQNQQNALRQMENEATNGPIREHYYSTIANEYESVGGGSISDSIYGTTTTATTTTTAIPIVNANNRTVSPLTLNVARLSGVYESTPPRPPTSPIPNRLPANVNPTRPVIVSPQPPSNSSTAGLMSTSLISTNERMRVSPSTADDRSTSNPNLASHHTPTNRPFDPATTAQGPAFLNSWHSQTATAALNNRLMFPRGQPRVIPPISATSTSFVSATTSRDDTARTAHRSIGTFTPTSTSNLVDSETQTNAASRIPLSTARLAHRRSQSPVVDTSTQTTPRIETERGKMAGIAAVAVRKSPSFNPLPTGKDYVSPIDLSSKRAWPLEGGEHGREEGAVLCSANGTAK